MPLAFGAAASAFQVQAKFRRIHSPVLSALRFMARLTRRFISKAKEKNLRRLISANGIAAAFNCICSRWALLRDPRQYASTLLLPPLPTPSAVARLLLGRSEPVGRPLPPAHLPRPHAEEARKKVNTSFIVIDFLFDLACVIPYDWLAHGSAACFSHGHLARLGLALRLFKLLREFTNFFCPALGMRRAVAQAARLCLYVASLLHWFACLNFGVAYQAITDELDLLEEYAAWRANATVITASGAVVDSRLGGYPRFSLYLRSLYRALCTFVGERVDSNSDVEVASSIFGTLVGTALVATVTSQVVDIVTTIGYTEARKRERIGRVEAYLRSRDVPGALKWRCLAHMEYALLQRDHHDEGSLDLLLNDLSRPLRDQLALHNCKKLVLGMDILSSAMDQGPDIALVTDIVRHLHLNCFSPMDELFLAGQAGDEVFLIDSGIVKFELADGTEIARRGPGTCIGEMAVFQSAPRSASAIAITFCEAYSIGKEDFTKYLIISSSLALGNLRMPMREHSRLTAACTSVLPNQPSSHPHLNR